MQILFCCIRYFLLLLRLAKLLAFHNEADYSFKEKFTHATHGSLKPTDAFLLAKLLVENKPLTILEVGSFLGLSTNWLLTISERWHAKVTAVDPNISHRIFSKPRLLLEQLNSRYLHDRLEIVTAFFGHLGTDADHFDANDSPERQSNLIEVVDASWGRTFDFIYIDGDHSYDAVMDNFTIAVKLLAPKGCIVFHDVLSWEGVSKALSEIALMYQGKATVELLGEGDRKLLKFIGRSNDGIGVFRLIDGSILKRIQT